VGKLIALMEPENQAKKIMCETGMEKIDYKKTENYKSTSLSSKVQREMFRRPDLRTLAGRIDFDRNFHLLDFCESTNKKKGIVIHIIMI
jgi:hypothetical protein